MALLWCPYVTLLYCFSMLNDDYAYIEKKEVLANREFSFTLRDEQQAEIYIRFQSFATRQALKADILKKCPEKIDLGAVYSAPPAQKATLRPGLFRPIERELVFDIDMTDYDDIRTCCKGAAICNKCWKFMALAQRILHDALTEDFGFKHILWVYSGRRGVHCWVCDDRARHLSEDARKAIVNYLEIVKGGDQMAKKVQFNQHASQLPLTQRNQKHIQRYFDEVVLEDQNVLMDPDMENNMLNLISNQQVRDKIAQHWSQQKSSRAKWDTLTKGLTAYADPKMRFLVQEIQFQYLYPRLDSQVSIHLNHLLKSPFCIHPKTGRVCVPIDMSGDGCEQFDPMAVPTVQQLAQQLADVDTQPSTQSGSAGSTLSEGGTKKERGEEWEKTDMKSAVNVFERFLAGLEQEQRAEVAKKREAEDRKLLF